MARAGTARPLIPPAGAAVSLADQAFYAIRELIVSLELAPGAVINERELVERLAIGRTPVREALRRLAQEKLVEVYPRRGIFVSTVDVRDLARLCEVRAVLEPEAAAWPPSARLRPTWTFSVTWRTSWTHGRCEATPR